MSLRSLSVETLPLGINNVGDGGGDKWCLDGSLSESVQINSSPLAMVFPRSSMFYSLSCSIISWCPPVFSMFITKNTLFKKEDISWKSNHVGGLTCQRLRKLNFPHCQDLASSWEWTKIMAIDALSHSRVKGFNMIIWSDHLEQIQCFKMLLFRVILRVAIHWCMCVCLAGRMSWWRWNNWDHEKKKFP